MLRKLPILLALLLIACSPVNVFERDEDSIRHWEEATEIFVEQISAAAEEQGELSEDSFPVGDLSWEEYESGLAAFESYLAHEEAKQDLEDLEEEED